MSFQKVKLVRIEHISTTSFRVSEITGLQQLVMLWVSKLYYLIISYIIFLIYTTFCLTKGVQLNTLTSMYHTFFVLKIGITIQNY